MLPRYYRVPASASAALRTGGASSPRPFGEVSARALRNKLRFLISHGAAWESHNAGPAVSSTGLVLWRRYGAHALLRVPPKSQRLLTLSSRMFAAELLQHKGGYVVLFRAV